MNPGKNCGGSAGGQVQEQTEPGHIIRDPSILTGDASDTNFQQQHHGFIPRQMNNGASTSSYVYYPFAVPLAAPRVPTVPINYGSSDHLLSSYNNMSVYGGSSEDFARNHFSDSTGNFYTIENVETSVGSYHRHPYESMSALVNAPIDTRHLYYGRPPLYAGGNRFLPITNDNHERSGRIRSRAAGPNPHRLSNDNGFACGIHGAESFQPASVFLLDQMVAGNHLLGPMGCLAWNHSPTTPVVHGQGDRNFHQLLQMQDMRNHCYPIHPRAPTPHLPLPSGAISVHNSRPVGSRPRGSSRQMRIGTNQPQTRGMPEAMQIPCDIPSIDEGVAVPDLPEPRTDHHRDMRMDIEDMSYEELLALGERIGTVNTGLSKDSIASQLQTRRYESQSLEGEAASCAICLCDYRDQEELGCLECGHDYHADCLKRWILERNVCPICKTEALPQR